MISNYERLMRHRESRTALHNDNNRKEVAAASSKKEILAIEYQ